MVIVPSLYPLNETSDNLRAAFDAAPENDFAAISHSNLAASVGLTLEPNNLIIFRSQTWHSDYARESKSGP
jgi:hypothetical protein